MANYRVMTRTVRDEGAFPCSCYTGDEEESIRRPRFCETYERSERLGLFDQRFDARIILNHCNLNRKSNGFPYCVVGLD